MFKKNYPKNPGVYWFLDIKGKVLYVGKAKNLNNRIKSYQFITPDSPKTLALLSKAKKIKYKTTDSELEAMLVEAELIRLYQPLYNLRLTDDKSPLYIYLTSAPFPHVKIGRSEDIEKHKIKKYNQFGPYPSGLKSKQVLKFMRSLFPFCNATKARIKNKQACFYSHLNLCPGACTGTISKSDYQKNITNLKLFLRGKKKSVLNSLQASLKSVSSKKQFEKAIIIRDQISMINALSNSPQKPELNLPNLEQDEVGNKLKSLLKILRLHLSLPKNYPLNRIEAYDVSNLEGKQGTASMVVFNNARPQTSEYRMFKIKTLNTPNDPAMLRETLSRRVKHSDWPTPNLMIIDGGITQLKAALSVVPWNIPVVSIAKNPDRLIIPPLITLPTRSVLVGHQKKPTRSVLVGKFIKIKLNQKQPATKLLQHLRDESHRFARNYHLKLRNRSIKIE